MTYTGKKRELLEEGNLTEVIVRIPKDIGRLIVTNRSIKKRIQRQRKSKNVTQEKV